jgi:serine/threonine protein kinase
VCGPMGLGRDRWVEVTPSRFAHEREGLEYVRAALPDQDPYRAWTGVEIITDRGRSLDVDLLVIAPAGLFVVELKAWSGTIAGDRYSWAIRHERGVRTESNPWRLNNAKARELKSILRDTLRRQTPRSRPDANAVIPWVQAVVFLHNPEVRCELREEDRTFLFGLDEATDRTGLPGLISGLLTQPPQDPGHVVTGRRSLVLETLLERSGMGRRRPRVISAYELGELIDEGDPGWQDFHGTHRRYADEQVRIRIYHAGTATTSEDRAHLDRAAEREYRLLRHLEHPGLIAPMQHVDTDTGPALIYPLDERAVRLDHLLATQGEALPLDRRLAIIRGIAETLRYAHGRHITHRGLTPKSVFVRLDTPNTLVRIADWHTGARSVTTSGTGAAGTVLAGTEHVLALLDPATHIYQAPEAGVGADVEEARLDVFSLGTLAYLVLTGHPPAPDLATLRQRLRADGGLDLAGHMDAVPERLRLLVLDATRGDVASRLPDMEAFLDRLAEVERDLAEPEQPEDLDPLEAPPGTVLGGRWRLARRLGGGATAVALLVEDGRDGSQAVLKVARDEERARRLIDEAEVLRGLDPDPRVASLLHPEPLRLAGRTALLLEFAGEDTLARVLREHGRLSLDRLERYGNDLLGVVGFLDARGVDHRDIKPDNLGIHTRRGARQKHLMLFDFSLSRTPASEIAAGTAHYLDPFLGQGSRRRWDGAAERYAVAVTLFEMATGALPVYGDGQSHPAVVEAEATVEPGMFDAAVAEPLTAFFVTAMRRNARERFDTVEEMHRAWRDVFRQVGAAIPEAGDLGPQMQAAELATPLERAGLTARALSALQPLGVQTVGELLDVPPSRLTRLAGANEATRREIRARARLWRQRLRPPEGTPAPGASVPAHQARGIDVVVSQLIPSGRGQGDTRVRAARLLLGLPADPERADQLPPLWPTQSDLAELLQVTRPRAQQLDADLRRRWSRSDTGRPLSAVRDEVVTFLEASGGVASAVEAAEALLELRGSVAEGPLRLSQAVGLVRAAVESELERGGDGPARPQPPWRRGPSWGRTGRGRDRPDRGAAHRLRGRAGSGRPRPGRPRRHAGAGGAGGGAPPGRGTTRGHGPPGARPPSPAGRRGQWYRSGVQSRRAVPAGPARPGGAAPFRGGVRRPSIHARRAGAPGPSAGPVSRGPATARPA